VTWQILDAVSDLADLECSDLADFECSDLADFRCSDLARLQRAILSTQAVNFKANQINKSASISIYHSVLNIYMLAAPPCHQ
jgi:hypothetical protein